MWPSLCVGAAVIFNLVALRAEQLPAQNLNDADVHILMIRWAATQLRKGRLPLDGWFPYFGAGSPHFHRYQSLAHITSAFFALIFGADRTYTWSLYILLSFWPVAVYFGVRLFGRSRAEAGASALLAPLIASAAQVGYEHIAYVWQGFGVWSQLWGMWALPIAWGLAWQAVHEGRRRAWAALAIAVTISVHLQTGELALLALPAFVLVDIERFRSAIRRAFTVGVGALLLGSWILLPKFLDAKWQTGADSAAGSIAADSYGAKRVLKFLFTGRLFDDMRSIPVLTVLVLIGLVLAVVYVRRDRAPLALSVLFLGSLFLFFGRPTWGKLLSLLPSAGETPFHRYVIGVHMAGVMLAGVAGVWIVRTGIEAARRFSVPDWAPAAAMSALCVLALVPGATERWTFDTAGRNYIAEQRTSDATDGRNAIELIRIARSLGPGRFYAGLISSWGAKFRDAYVPIFNILAQQGEDAIGFTLRTASLTDNVERRFDETNLDEYDLFDVKYLLLPATRKPPVPAKLIASRGSYRLYHVATTGYFEVVDTVGPITADRTDIGQQTAGFVGSVLLPERRFPTMAYAGVPPAPATLVGTASGLPGVVDRERVDPVDGSFSADVTVARRSVALLKSTFDPRWRVLVDGKPAKTEMIAPTFVGVVVAPGRHHIHFSYRAIGYYPLLFALGLGAFLLLMWADRRTGQRAGVGVGVPR